MRVAKKQGTCFKYPSLYQKALNSKPLNPKSLILKWEGGALPPGSRSGKGSSRSARPYAPLYRRWQGLPRCHSARASIVNTTAPAAKQREGERESERVNHQLLLPLPLLPQVVNCLVAAEADLHQADRIGQSPLFIAADVGHLHVVRHLHLGSASQSTP